MVTIHVQRQISLANIGDKMSSVADPGGGTTKAWVCGRRLAGIAGSNPAAAWLSVSCLRVCVLLRAIRRNNNPLHLQSDAIITLYTYNQTQ